MKKNIEKSFRRCQTKKISQKSKQSKEKFQKFLVSLNLSNPSLFSNKSTFYYRTRSSKQTKVVNKMSGMESTKNNSEINQQNENMNGMNFQVKLKQKVEFNIKDSET